jgi:NTE family protein
MDVQRYPVPRRKSMAGSLARRHYAILVLVVCSLTLSGCVALNIENTRLEKADPMHGYRPRSPAQRRDPGKAIIFLAFSGGGTRAAALAYGVLEELRATKIGGDESQSLLDEVDTISGVSGGSFTAAYYGLYGERIFDEFEPRFLRKNIQLALILQSLKPWNFVRLLTPSLNRSDLASRYYHENVFDNATFADLTVAGGPKIHINATDLSSGDRFTFNQDSADFYRRCGKLGGADTALARHAPQLCRHLQLRFSRVGQTGHRAARQRQAPRSIRKKLPARTRCKKEELLSPDRWEHLRQSRLARCH